MSRRPDRVGSLAKITKEQRAAELDVWNVVGDLGAISTWLPAIVESPMPIDFHEASMQVNAREGGSTGGSVDGPQCHQ